MKDIQLDKSASTGTALEWFDGPAEIYGSVAPTRPVTGKVYNDEKPPRAIKPTDLPPGRRVKIEGSTGDMENDGAGISSTRRAVYQKIWLLASGK